MPNPATLGEQPVPTGRRRTSAHHRAKAPVIAPRSPAKPRPERRVDDQRVTPPIRWAPRLSEELRPLISQLARGDTTTLVVESWGQQGISEI
jgi:hypothetical protein